MVIYLAQRREPVEHHGLGVLGIVHQLLGSNHHAGQITVVTVHEDEFSKPARIKAKADLLRQCDEGGGAERYGADKTHVKTGDAEGDFRPDDHRAATFLKPQRGPATIFSRLVGVRPQRQVGTMSLGGAEGQEQHLRLLNALFKLRPAHFRQRRRPLLRIDDLFRHVGLSPGFR